MLHLPHHRSQLLALLLPAVLFVGSLRGQTISIRPERPSALFQRGETIRWNVSVTESDKLKSPSYIIKSGGQKTIGSGTLVLDNGLATLETKLDEPGWVLLEVDGTSATNTKLQAYGGAVVEAEKITPAAARPADFDAFWDAKLAELNTIPINPLLTPGVSGKAGVDYSTVMLDGIHGTHVQGQLARPTAGSSLPALLIVQWAGVYGLQKPWVTERAAEGWLVLNIQAHDITPLESEAFYQALNTGALKDYPHQGNEDRETSYFLRMYLACHRAAEYLTTRPDWNGRTLVVMGASQGGLQTIVTAALHPKVTAALAEVPAGCDQAGLDASRLPGWPAWVWQTWDRDPAKVMQTSRYYDTTNFAPRIHCPVLFGVGFIDSTVPPPGVYATYNLLSGARQMVPMPLADHSNNHTPYYAPQSAWLQDAKAARLPTIKIAPQSVSAKLGEAVAFSVVATDGQAFGYQWLKNGSPIPNATMESLSIAPVTSADAADYSVTVTSPGGSITSASARLSIVTETPVRPQTRLTNLSTRAQVGSGNDLLIAGFVVGGYGAKRVLIRGVGPTLKPFGVDKPLTDPQLTLTNLNNEQLGFNDDWNNATNASSIRDVSNAIGAFALPEASKDSALLLSLPPGTYTALLRGASNGTGVGLVEVYDVDTGCVSRLTNISARSRVDFNNQLIAGYVMSGPTKQSLLVRAMSPSLAPFNLSPLLAHPRLRLVTSTNVELQANQGWENSLSATKLPALCTQLGATPQLQAGLQDSALFASQQAGICTAVVEATPGDSGIALVEVYEAPEI